MDRSSPFRARLSRRLLQIASVAALAPLTQMACSDDTEDDGTNPSTSSTSGTPGSTGSSTGSGASSSSSGSSSGAAGGEGGSSAGGGGAGGISAGGAGGTAQGGAGGTAQGGAGGTAQGGAGGAGQGGAAQGGAGVGGGFSVCPTKPDCFTWTASLTCPAMDQAIQYFADDCADGCMPLEVLSQGVLNGQMCCYKTSQISCAIIGRPFLVGDRMLYAEARPGGARGWTEREAAPDATALSPELREVLAAEWLSDALLEHASVAAFSRFSLELLAVGAPADLVALSHEAALDEVRHARRCFALAGAYRGHELEPAPFPFGGSVEVSADLADVAVRAAREGCVGETLAAALAAEQGARASDPAVRAVLAGIAEDEARHAELAWRTVAWAIRTGGDRVRQAVAAVFAEATRELSQPEPTDTRNPDLEAHGRLEASAAQSVKRRALRDIVLPCAAALAPHPTRFHATA